MICLGPVPLDTLHGHDLLEAVALDEEIVFRLVILDLADDRSVDGRDALEAKARGVSTASRGSRGWTDLDDDVEDVALDGLEAEVRALVLVKVDGDARVVGL